MTMYDDETLLALLALDMKFKRLVEIAQESKMEENVVREVLDKVAAELVKIYHANSSLREQCFAFLHEVHRHFQDIYIHAGRQVTMESPEKRMARVEAFCLVEAVSCVARPRSHSWSGAELRPLSLSPLRGTESPLPSSPRLHSPSSTSPPLPSNNTSGPVKVTVDIDVQPERLEEIQADRESLLMLERAYKQATQKGVKLWKQQKIDAAYKELMRGERLSTKLHALKQQIAIEEAMRSMKRSNNLIKSGVVTGPLAVSLSPKQLQKKQRTVRFSENPTVVGFADADVDRKPISVTPSSTMETLLIRSFRQFPSIASAGFFGQSSPPLSPATVSPASSAASSPANSPKAATRSLIEDQSRIAFAVTAA